LAWAERRTRDEFVHYSVQGELDRKVIPYPAQLRPGCPLTIEHGLDHETRRRVSEDVWELRIRDLRHDGDVASVSLTEHRAKLRHGCGKNAQFGQDVHSVQRFTFSEVGQSM